jgi:hypothetical protein
MNASVFSMILLGTVAPPPADTVVWHARGPEAPRFAVVEETLSIGGAHDDDPNYNLYGHSAIAIGLDGSIVVLQAAPVVGQVLLRMYDAEGRFVRHLGRTGQGPGEFLRPTSVAALPDGRFLLTDLQLRRMTVYSAEGAFEETWSVPFHRVFDGRVRVGPDGIVAVQVSDGSREDRWRAMVRVAPGGAVIDTLMVPELPELGPPRMEIRDPPRTSIRSPPYYPVSTWTWHPQGYFITARTDRYAIDLLLPQRSPHDGDRPARWRPGDPVVSLRAEVDPVPVHPDERRAHEQYLQDWLRRTSGERTGSLGPVPAVMPILSSIHVGNDGRIWISVNAGSERIDPVTVTLASGEVVEEVPWRRTVAWDAFQPNGVYLGRVSFPTSLTRPQFQGDEVWGFVRDDLGIPTLKRYRIHWPDPP